MAIRASLFITPSVLQVDDIRRFFSRWTGTSSLVLSTTGTGRYKETNNCFNNQVHVRTARTKFKFITCGLMSHASEGPSHRGLDRLLGLVTHLLTKERA
jgi:hypothetical protein